MSIIEDLAKQHLGQQNQYIDQYDPNLLVKIPRIYNREVYGIDEQNLPFVGTDVWHAYEVSALTQKGLPVSGMLKIIVAADTKCIVESKSLKLYLNSFNMTKLGHTEKECIQELEQKIKSDLSKLLEADVQCQFYKTLPETQSLQNEYKKLSEKVDLDAIDFTQSSSEAPLLKIETASETLSVIKIQSDLLRSNCRVTNQPDWGDVLIYMEGANIPDYVSIAQYIVSHRKLNHFHEEVCEMMYMHFMEAYQSAELMIACLYTRRGGIDINPIRASSGHLIPRCFKALNFLNQKTLRQ
ncbi:hypothetical protein N8865_01545 [Francisellaceae bacterium]|nr:hypothetical protein [Francisellaceae bacterium]